jgi:ubiquinone/menaquinone biosynthesis C-methylase UbiE
MLQIILKRGRSWARDNLLTFNTIRYRVEFPRILDAFAMIGKQECVLDGGAGSGQMLRKVFEQGYCERGIAYEYDPALYKILLSNHRDLPNFSAKQGSLLEIPYEDESVDCAMTTQVLEHIEDHEKAASELSRIVKRGGHVIVSVPHPPEPFHTPGHLREGYTEEDLKALFPASDFQLLLTGYSMTRPTMERAMLSAKLPLKGCFMPVAWADQETGLTNEERKQQLPYAITCLFRKVQLSRA